MARGKKAESAAGIETTPAERIKARAVSDLLLAWYDHHARTLPWRAPSGQCGDPYHVWLSEIMLQQTTVTAVKPYFETFLTAWPRVEDLAAAKQEDVLAAWAGLGYYARARNLHRCAQVVTEDHGGQFPADETLLLKLPGVGPYTAAAIGAIAFGLPTAPVDGNIERVLSRLFLIETPLPFSKPQIKAHAADMIPYQRPGDMAQALMDLGFGICQPKSAKCLLCPLNDLCLARKADRVVELPKKQPKAAKPKRRGVVFWIENEKGEVLLRRRPQKGLLAGMLEFPCSEWSEHLTEAQIQAATLPAGEPETLRNGVRHVFTHFQLDLEIRRQSHRGDDTTLLTTAGLDAQWVKSGALDDIGLPSVMLKVVRLCQAP